MTSVTQSVLVGVCLACCLAPIVSGQTLGFLSLCINSTTDCLTRAIGQYPLCTDCTQFVKCVGSASRIFTCPSNLLYDYRYSVCNFIGETACGSVMTQTTPSGNPTVAFFSTCVSVAADCIGKAHGQYALCNNCSQFVFCGGDVRGQLFVIKSCPVGEQYHAPRGVCGFTGQVTCGTVPAALALTITDAIPTTTTPMPSTTTPMPTTTSPMPSTTTPMPTSPMPTTTTPMPTTTTPMPTTTTPMPTTTSPMSTTTTLMPTTTTSIPTTTTPMPTTTTPLPTTTSPMPTTTTTLMPTTSTPMPTTTTPMPTTTTPMLTTSTPMPTTTSPMPTTTTPMPTTTTPKPTTTPIPTTTSTRPTNITPSVRCITSCAGLSDGDYHSCTSCNVYATCTNNVIVDNRPCAFPLQFDANIKMCNYVSSTCSLISLG